MDYNNIDINNLQEINRIQQLEQMKKVLLGQILTKEAYERLSRVRMANPQLASQVEMYFLNIYQTGKLQGAKIDDKKLREVLRILSSDERGFNIRRM